MGCKRRHSERGTYLCFCVCVCINLCLCLYVHVRPYKMNGNKVPFTVMLCTARSSNLVMLFTATHVYSPLSESVGFLENSAPEPIFSVPLIQVKSAGGVDSALQDNFSIWSTGTKISMLTGPSETQILPQIQTLNIWWTTRKTSIKYIYTTN